MANQNRLPISEPNVRRRAQEFARRRKLAHTSETGLDDLASSSVGDSLAEPQKKLDTAPSLSKKRWANQPANAHPGLPSVEVVSQAIQIQIDTEAERPFELADLFTRKWIQRNSSFLVSFAFHLALFLVLSFFLLHGTGKALIVLEMMTSPKMDTRTGAESSLSLTVTRWRI